MKPIKCSVCTKFYDGDKYEVCPHCDGVAKKKDITLKEPEQKPASTGKPTSKGFMSGLIKHHTKSENPVVIISDEDNSASNDVPDFPEIEDAAGKSVSVKPELPKSQSGSKPVSASPVVPPESPAAPVPEQPSPKKAAEEDDSDEYFNDPAAPSLAEAIKKTESTSNSSDSKTVAFYNFSNDIEPVVGWLICVKGEYQGESFQLKSGRNSIGRSLNNDVKLAQEKTVSRERHVFITFEPHKKTFFIQSGESSGLTYVNDEILLMFRELNDYDVITLGAAQFVFLRLVGDKFSWEDYTD